MDGVTQIRSTDKNVNFVLCEILLYANELKSNVLVDFNVRTHHIQEKVKEMSNTTTHKRHNEKRQQQ